MTGGSDSDQRWGVAMVLTGVGLVATIASFILLKATHNPRAFPHQADLYKAHYIAEQGMRFAIDRLSRDPDWKGERRTLQSTSQEFEVRTYRQDDPVAPVGISIPDGQVYVLSTGRNHRVIRRVAVMVQPGVGVLDYAVVTKNGITISENSEIRACDPVTGKTLEAEYANIATNSIDDGAIKIDATSEVYGNIEAGPDAPYSTFEVEEGAAVVGTLGALASVVPMDPITIEFDTTQVCDESIAEQGVKLLRPGTYGDLLSEERATLELEPGEYTVRSMSIVSEANLKTTGPTTICVVEGVKIEKGSVVNSSCRPLDLVLMVDGGPVTISELGAAHFVLYAPNSDITVRNSSSIYGNVIGRRLILEEAASVYYDPRTSGALIDGGDTTVKVVSWESF